MGVGRNRWIEVTAAIAWIAVIFCLVAQCVTEAAMQTPYSLLRDAISDLGAARCTPQICSPWFRLVDASFVVLGLCLAVGGVLSHLSAPRDRLWWGAWAATGALGMGGIGMAIIGFVPEDVHFRVHVGGALAGLIGANVGALFAGLALHRARGHRVTGVTAVVVGAVGFLGSALSVLVFGKFLPALLGVGGGLERLGVWPLLGIMFLSGGALLFGEDVLAKAYTSTRRFVSARGRNQRDVAPASAQGVQVDLESLTTQLVDQLGEQKGQVVHNERRTP